MNSYGFSQSINILLDQGSQQSYISNKCINRLNLRKQSVNNVSVNCLTGKQITIKSKVLITISNESGGYVRSIECLAVPRIVERLPINHLNISSLQFPNVKLANPNFNNPNAIDLLISAEYVYEILQPGQIKIPNSNITLVNSVFGYVVTGVAEVCNDKNRVYRGDVNGAQYTNSVYCGMVTREEDLNEELKKFWVIENACYDTTEINKTEEELLCEKHYVDTHKRDHMGKYIVQMPLRDNPLCLGESRDIAIRKLNSQYKHLVKEPEYLKLYNNFIEEYLSLGHMEKVSEDSGNNATYYIPHLGVRSHSVTTPLRIVFNASSLTNNGKSLNDLQYNGGTVQDDLYSIMIRFRKHKIVFIADIEKMYRAIWMDPSQRDLLRIVWKYGEKDPIQTFRLKTVSYGLTSSAFLSTRTLKQLAIDEGEHFPLAAKVTQSDFYVDDVLTGEKDLERAKILKDELNVMLQKGGMRLHKWATNAQELLGDGTVTCKDYHFSVEAKTLGVMWVPGEDCFIFRLNITTPTIITKRSVLSNIATIFDPVGLIQPVLTNAKAFMQRLWLLKVEWNDPLPAKEASEWESFLTSLQSINCIKVQRYIYIDNAEIVEVHGFCDASEKAYGAVIYVKCISSSGDISSNLLTSKSRVAPTKTMTIPKLELSGALLLAQLYTKIVKALKTTIHRTYLWCDSKIVLAWLQKEPMQLKQFIANRVNTIQNLTKISDWRHVPSDRNAADILSRGTEMKNLIRNEMWWFGPAFIKQFEFPETILDPPAPEYHEGLKEHKNSMTDSPDSIALAVTQGGGGSESLVDYLLNRSNNFTKILYVLSYLFRFVFNVRNPNGKKQGPISRNEIEEAKAFIVKDVQCRYFPSEISCLQKGKLLSPSSTIKNLNPYLDDNEILRVGGRLHNSNLNDNVKHPIILPAKAKLTEIIVEYFHIKNLHLGPQALLYSVRSIFWPVHGRNICRKVVHRCVTCFRARPVVSEQLMGNLPKERVSKNFPFSCSGVDYCGPFEIKYKGQRRGIYRKVYVCIFICMVTKAIHLEMVGDLTTEAFIATLKRFSARRGKPQKVFSDNARNFLGASAEIKRLHKIMSAPDSHLAHYLALENIEWSFIAPRGPHQGGLWEAGVKAFKYHFKRVVGNAKLSYEEFLTIMNQIEGMLNSRPLTPLTSDIDDLEVLTPGHFLIGRPMNQIVEPDLVDLETNRLNLWQKTTKLVQQIWKRWKNSYLNTLQQRTKWMFLKDNVAVGNIVLIKEDNLPMYKWALGRILEIKPGRDKIVRVAIVKTQNGILTRPITKLCVLPIEK